MITTNHPFTAEVVASERKPGTYDWTLRRHGKLIQRSDREYRSEAEAQSAAEKAIERQFSDQHKVR